MIGRMKLCVRSHAVPLVTLLLLALSSCTTLIPTSARPPSIPHHPRASRLDLARLSDGMPLERVKRVEPPPQRVFTMQSGEMTIVKWVYLRKHGRVVLYFANGLLESWSD